jgi:peptidyl-prolyl cis-trans isomerase C
VKCLPPVAALIVLLQGGAALAQSASPAAPTSTNQPSYDTQTPQYNTGGQATAAQKTIVAEVDGRPITLGDVGDEIRALPPAISQRPFELLFQQARASLIQKQAFVILAHQTGVDEDPAVQRQIRAATDRILADAWLAKTINAQITETALLASYKDIVEGKPGPEEVRFRLILVGTRKEPVDAIAEIQGGADFAAVAHRISKDPTGAIGGEVAFSSLDSLLPEIGSVVFALNPGQLAPNPIRAAGAWYVLKTEERRATPTPPFPVVREILLHALQRQMVAAAAKEAMAKVTVHEFSISGKEATADKP